MKVYSNSLATKRTLEKVTLPSAFKVEVVGVIKGATKYLWGIDDREIID